LKKEFPRASRSTDIPISPLSALLRSKMETFIVIINLLYLSSSYRSTTYVGDGISNDFLMLYSSNTSGIDFVRISSAMLVIMSSLLDPPAPPPSEVYISKIHNQRSFAALLKYEISAFE